MMVWNDGEKYGIGFFYKVVWKDIDLSRNFWSMWVLGINYRPGPKGAHPGGLCGAQK